MTNWWMGKSETFFSYPEEDKEFTLIFNQDFRMVIVDLSRSKVQSIILTAFSLQFSLILTNETKRKTNHQNFNCLLVSLTKDAPWSRLCWITSLNYYPLHRRLKMLVLVTFAYIIKIWNKNGIFIFYWSPVFMEHFLLFQFQFDVQTLVAFLSFFMIMLNTTMMTMACSFSVLVLVAAVKLAYFSGFSLSVSHCNNLCFILSAAIHIYISVGCTSFIVRHKYPHRSELEHRQESFIFK